MLKIVLVSGVAIANIFVIVGIFIFKKNYVLLVLIIISIIISTTLVWASLFIYILLY